MENILMPIIGIVFGKPNFDDVMILTINDSQIRIGAFLTVAVTVLLTALGVFLFIVKPYNRFRAAHPGRRPTATSAVQQRVLQAGR
ncbi:MAG: MscL family protein [Acidimicrobiales bacterium]